MKVYQINYRNAATKEYLKKCIITKYINIKELSLILKDVNFGHPKLANMLKFGKQSQHIDSPLGTAKFDLTSQVFTIVQIRLHLKDT